MSENQSTVAAAAMRPEQLVAQNLNYVFKKPILLDQALTHSTWLNEYATQARPNQQPSSLLGCYQRLEFLGDAVLQLLTSDHLYESMPHAEEGALSRRRAQWVREPTLAALAQEIGLGAHLRLGASQADVPVPQSILADVMEAVLAAIYLDGGLEAVKAVFERLLPRLQALGDGIIDHKTRLQELCHKQGLPGPIYAVEEVRGPAHAKIFHVTLSIGDGVATRGRGTSKRAAQQLCAREALKILGPTQQS